jgi:hypothetical protein
LFLARKGRGEGGGCGWCFGDSVIVDYYWPGQKEKEEEQGKIERACRSGETTTVYDAAQEEDAREGGR